MQTPAQATIALESVDAAPAVEVVKAPVKRTRAKAESKPVEGAVSTPVEKTATLAKAARKPAATKAKPKAAVKSRAIAHCLVNRPSSGGVLYAFTQAVLNLTGMMDGKPASRALLRTVMGDTAVRYHINKTTFAIDDNGAIILTPVGVYSFTERKVKGQIDQTMVEAFEQLLIDGQENANLPGAKQVNIRAV